MVKSWSAAFSGSLDVDSEAAKAKHEYLGRSCKPLG